MIVLMIGSSADGFNFRSKRDNRANVLALGLSIDTLSIF